MVIKLLTNRVGLNSSNSSKPPSSDLNKKNQDRKKSTKSTGGQPGHVSKTLVQVDDADADADDIDFIKIDRRTLPKGDYECEGVEKRQVFDITNPNIRYHMSPVSVFNGDVLLTADGPSNNSYLLIGDATGHGLPAAVGVIPIYSAFRTMAAKGLTVGTIAAEINKSLLQLLPDHMMLAAAILQINTHSNQLLIWSGGLPNLIIADQKGAIKQQISAFHPPLAGVDDAEFSQNLQVYDLEKNDKIYLFTDGIEESYNSDQEMFGEQRLHEMFNGDGGDIFTRILEDHARFTENTV
ncbi:MAG: serine phosphatase RsbU (regulator of sigma subunit) [Pseudohongiellaceae bacterium]